MSAKWSKTPHTDRMYDKRTGSISEWTNKKRAMPLVIRFNATAKYFIHTINSIRLLAFILNYKCICVNFFELRADDAISIKASSVLLFIVSSRANGIAHHIRIFFVIWWSGFSNIHSKMFTILPIVSSVFVLLIISV